MNTYLAKRLLLLALILLCHRVYMQFLLQLIQLRKYNYQVAKSYGYTNVVSVGDYVKIKYVDLYSAVEPVREAQKHRFKNRPSTKPGSGQVFSFKKRRKMHKQFHRFSKKMQWNSTIIKDKRRTAGETNSSYFSSQSLSQVNSTFLSSTNTSTGTATNHFTAGTANIGNDDEYTNFIINNIEELEAILNNLKGFNASREIFDFDDSGVITSIDFNNVTLTNFSNTGDLVLKDYVVDPTCEATQFVKKYNLSTTTEVHASNEAHCQMIKSTATKLNSIADRNIYEFPEMQSTFTSNVTNSNATFIKDPINYSRNNITFNLVTVTNETILYDENRRANIGETIHNMSLVKNGSAGSNRTVTVNKHLLQYVDVYLDNNTTMIDSRQKSKIESNANIIISKFAFVNSNIGKLVVRSNKLYDNITKSPTSIKSANKDVSQKKTTTIKNQLKIKKDVDLHFTTNYISIVISLSLNKMTLKPSTSLLTSTTNTAIEMSNIFSFSLNETTLKLSTTDNNKQVTTTITQLTATTSEQTTMTETKQLNTTSDQLTTSTIQQLVTTTEQLNKTSIKHLTPTSELITTMGTKINTTNTQPIVPTTTTKTMITTSQLQTTISLPVIQIILKKVIKEATNSTNTTTVCTTVKSTEMSRLTSQEKSYEDVLQEILKNEFMAEETTTRGKLVTVLKVQNVIGISTERVEYGMPEMERPVQQSLSYDQILNNILENKLLTDEAEIFLSQQGTTTNAAIRAYQMTSLPSVDVLYNFTIKCFTLYDENIDRVKFINVTMTRNADGKFFIGTTFERVALAHLSLQNRQNYLRETAKINQFSIMSENEESGTFANKTSRDNNITFNVVLGDKIKPVQLINVTINNIMLLNEKSRALHRVKKMAMSLDSESFYPHENDSLNNVFPANNVSFDDFMMCNSCNDKRCKKSIWFYPNDTIRSFFSRYKLFETHDEFNSSTTTKNDSQNHTANYFKDKRCDCKMVQTFKMRITPCCTTLSTAISSTIKNEQCLFCKQSTKQFAQTTCSFITTQFQSISQHQTTVGNASSQILCKLCKKPKCQYKSTRILVSSTIYTNISKSEVCSTCSIVKTSVATTTTILTSTCCAKFCVTSCYKPILSLFPKITQKTYVQRVSKFKKKLFKTLVTRKTSCYNNPTAITEFTSVQPFFYFDSRNRDKNSFNMHCSLIDPFLKFIFNNMNISENDQKGITKVEIVNNSVKTYLKWHNLCIFLLVIYL